eukprot:TRINITY_DN10259_c0_g1_i1.p2 TRINITY_DN10259_c0_g1~~TRINITY_DN10259_c0_g1_i1.p2  ORF type:complete len:144 (-),score=33.31 TRINITY_DN10259_c0_g1_i1:47-478(-)
MMKTLFFLCAVALVFAGVPSISFNCAKTDDILSGQGITWSPKDVHSNEKLTITAHGTMSQEVTGGDIHVSAKLDGIPVLTKQFDLCDALKQANLTCPIPKGPAQVALTVDIPSIPVHGTVSVEATAVTKASKEITCVSGHVKL